jgi:hypothetical protein
LAIEGQNERNRLAIVKRPGRIGNADDPRAIGVLRDDDRKSAVKLGSGGAVGESTLVGRVSGATRIMPNGPPAKTVELQATQPKIASTTRNILIMAIPPYCPQRNAITGCREANNDEATFAPSLN